MRRRCCWRAAEALYTELTPANWTAGFAECLDPGGESFVSSALDGFVLVVGNGEFSYAERQDELEALAKRFREVQFFASHRVSGVFCWVNMKTALAFGPMALRTGKCSGTTAP